jgi:acyl carrier protein
MTIDEIRLTLATIIAEKVNRNVTVGQVQWDSRLRDDLGIDSLAVTELFFEIQEAFGTSLENADPNTLLTVRDAVNAIAHELQIRLAS